MCIRDRGRCFKNTVYSECKAQNMTWIADPNCELPQCEKGCCILGDQAFFVTKVRCKQITSLYPELTMVFKDDIKSEKECVDAVRALDKGCCVKEDGTCIFTTRENCDAEVIVAPLEEGKKYGPGFYKNVLCSNDKLPCQCARQQKIGCVPGKDEVYWFDSCGNPENIYDSNRERSYNNGYVLPKEESCKLKGPEDPNCGNCEYASGTICGKDVNGVMPIGEYTCRNINCETTYKDDSSPYADGGLKKNGESWCVYDGSVGHGRDLVGSRHYRHMCINGEEIVEPCRDFREEFCLQNTRTLNGESYTEARCLYNDIYDSGITTEVSTVPIGGKFWDPNDELKKRCESANLECKMFWAKATRYGEFVCLENCGCEYEDEVEEEGLEYNGNCGDKPNCQSQEWVNKMATYCKSKGDCGVDFNVLGKSGHHNFYVDGKHGDPDDEGCINPAEPFSGVKNCHWDTESINIGVGNVLLEEWENKVGISENLRNLALSYDKIKSEEPSLPSDWELWMEPVLWEALLDTLTIVLMNRFLSESVSEFLSGKMDWSVMFGMPNLAGRGASWIGSGIGVGLDLLAKLISRGKLTEQDWINTISNFIYNNLAVIIGKLLAKNAAEKAAEKAAYNIFGGPVGIALFFINIFLDVWSMTGGEVKDVSVYTHCGVWEPPDGGDDCEKCDMPKSEGGLLPDINGKILPGYSCTEYLCKSLGKACEFIKENEGSGRPSCYHSNPNDVNKPIISVWDDTFKVEYKGEDVTENYDISGLTYGFEIEPKLPPYSTVTFGIITDELAQCKYSPEHTNNMDEMVYGFSEYPYFTKEHNITINVEPDTEYTFYVRCSDPHGNGKDSNEYTIKFSAQPGPDYTPPMILEVSPRNGAYIGSDQNLTRISLYLDEPSRCKWSHKDVQYDLMPENNSFICSRRYRRFSYQKYGCIADLPVNKGVNTYYIRCQDISENKNTMQESYQFTLIGTEPLVIKQVSPEGTLYYNDVVLQVITEGGAEGGKAVCRFNGIEFYETNSTLHKQELHNLNYGTYFYKINCTDIAGNSATGTIKFKVGIDRKKPVIEKIFSIGERLYIATNEPTNCEALNQTFEFGNGRKMTGKDSLTHTIEIEPQLYIICKDLFGNEEQISVKI